MRHTETEPSFTIKRTPDNGAGATSVQGPDVPTFGKLPVGGEWVVLDFFKVR